MHEPVVPLAQRPASLPAAEGGNPLLADWAKWGFARHPYFLRASNIAAAVVAVVSAPRGAHLVLVEVQPEAPLRKDDE